MIVPVSKLSSHPKNQEITTFRLKFMDFRIPLNSFTI